jgi:DNA topoisomerase I
MWITGLIHMIEKGSKLVCADETCGYVESKNDKEQ